MLESLFKKFARFLFLENIRTVATYYRGKICGNLLSIKFLKVTRRPEKTLKVFSLLKILMRQTQFFPVRREIAWRKSLRDSEATVHRC